ncbi:MAG TPA: hypothetical protein VF267_09425, partial [Gammaproteobacteria bacterium]
GGGGGGGGGDVPTAAVSPQGDLGTREAVIVSFSESMDPASLQLGGSMADVAATEWSAAESKNDTVTIVPSASWESGMQTLTVDGESSDAKALDTVEVEFRVRAEFSDFQPAAVVIGQADFSGGTANQGGSVDANTLDNPVGAAGFAVDENTLFISDTGSSRVLGFSTVPADSNANADFVIGQADFTADVAETGAGSLRMPQTVTATNGRLVVADTDSHRVLIYNAIPASGPVDADVVVGQTAMTARDTACNATSLNTPESHFVTPDGKLIVADSGNNRVLIWNELPTANASPPDLVLGQDDFVHCTANDDDQDATPSPDWPPHSYTLSYPTGIWSDGERLLVADSGNHRVLIWNEFPTENFAPADRLLGQNSFRTMAANDDDQDGVTDPDGTASQHVFDFPFGVWSDGMQIFVADRNNNRVLVWDEYPERFFEAAAIVLGQENFQNNAANDADQDGTPDAGPSQTTMNQPTGIRLIGDRVVVTDTGNSRVLIFDAE